MEIELLRKELQQLGSLEGQLAAQKFHKEPISTYGIKVPVVRTLSNKWYSQIKNLDKDEILSLCDDLFKSGSVEESLIAAEWIFKLRKQFQEEDFVQFENWIGNHIKNWATCDTFCNNTVGAFLLKYPNFISELNRWATTNHRWLQRAAAVSLIVPARQGYFLQEAFTIAELEFQSDDDLVQKGYGWLLKANSKKNMEAVVAFVRRHKEEMPRTALRYAVEHFPPELRREILGRSVV